jgi:hypothetical protein
MRSRLRPSGVLGLRLLAVVLASQLPQRVIRSDVATSGDALRTSPPMTKLKKKGMMMYPMVLTMCSPSHPPR